jgi:hypothetical protein
MNEVQNITASFVQAQSPTASLVAAVLPSSRSVSLGNTATAFATILNLETATAPGCTITPIGTVPENFLYQTTDPGTNAVTGTANTPTDIAGGGSQTFIVSLTPTAGETPTAVPFSFACSNVPAAPALDGVNTLLLSASTTSVPDIVALAATASNDGILHISGSSGANAFAVATIDLGSSDTITAIANTGEATLSLSLAICETDPSSGQCLAPPSGSATTPISANATPTFAIFGAANGTIPFDPANSRIFVQFTGSDGTIRGETSVAVTTTQ